MVVLLRESSAARNLEDLLPAVTAASLARFCLCTDDRHPGDLMDSGSIDLLVRKAIAAGLNPMSALRMATCNPAQHYRLHDRGAIGPGRRADLIAFRQLEAPRPLAVWSAGRLVARDGQALFAPRPLRRELASTMNVDWRRVSLQIPAGSGRARVIGVVPGQIVTRSLLEEVDAASGQGLPDARRDLLELAVIERHRGSGAVGLGLVRGVGLRSGALASSVAHDHHNIVVAGADERSMWTAARRCADMGGGLVAALDDRVLAGVPLPVAGLMSDRTIDTVRGELDAAVSAAHDLGAAAVDPFMTMSFLALEVIPELKLTDQGLVDVATFSIVPLWTG
jgi:adenine deaminase